MANGGSEPFPLSVMLTQGIEQTRKAMESYLDFFQKNIKASPLLDTDLNKKMKTYMEQNIAAATEFAQKASKAKDLQDFWQIQTEFMQAQWKAFTEQTKDLAETAAKSATDAMKGLSS
jgi:phasin family protein